MKRVAIVGSGISACACAVALKEKGCDVTLFEKAPVPGGKLCTEKVNGFTVEAGPDSFLPEKFWTVDLIKKVGLQEELLCTNEEHKGTYIYSGGRLHRLPEGVMLMVPTMIMPLLRSSLISLPGKLRMGLELVIPRKEDEGDESLAHFVSRRLGRECLEKIAEPLVAGIHTSNPENMSVRAIFPRFLELERKHGSLIRGMVKAMKSVPPRPSGGRQMTYFMSLKGGMEQLVDACIAVVGREKVRTSVAVERVMKTDRGYDLVTNNGKESFPAVVLSTPSYVTEVLVRDMAPGLAERLSPIEWSSTATVSLAFKKADVATPLPGFGFIVPKVENRRINAATWSSVKWSFRSPADHLLIRCFAGGGHHEELVDRTEEELVGIILQELSEIAGIHAKPVTSRVYRWIKSMPRYTVGHLERVAAIDEARRAYPGLYLIGCSYRGIGIGDCVKSGFDAASDIASS